MSRSRLFALALSSATVLGGCGEGFTPPSKIEGLRVLAVRAEPPAGAPGAVVSFSMLHADAGARSREVQIAWLAGCHNPPSRQYYECLPLLRNIAAQGGGGLGVGPRFELAIPDDILSSAPRVPTDPVHFGVSYVFFAVCAGTLRPRPDFVDRIPIECVDPATEQALGAGDFVIGFSTIYSYEGASNANPRITGLAFDGVPAGAAGHDGLPIESPCADASECASPDENGRERTCSEGRCVTVIPACRDDACPAHRLEPTVARESAERVFGGHEIVWVNYYATAGAIAKPTQLVSDRTSGWVDDYSTNWRAPREAVGHVRLWATVHDQRSGADWASLELYVGQ